MNSTLKGFVALAAASIPFVAALLFFNGNSYYESRLAYWGADSSMFPDSVVEKVYLGSHVIAHQVIQMAVPVLIAIIISLIIIAYTYRFVLWLERWLNPVFDKFSSFLFSRFRTGINNYRPSDFERTSFIVFASSALLIVLAIGFSAITKITSSASRNLAIETQKCVKEDFDSYHDGNKSGVCNKGLQRKKTKFIMNDNSVVEGFVVECSIHSCLVYTDKRKREIISQSDVKRNIMADI